MRRGRSQATYRYLPGMFIDFEDGNCITYIDRWDSYEVKEEINKIRIIEEIKKGLPRFGEKRVFENKSVEDFVILSPRYGIEVELSPLTFICSQCGLAHSFFNLSHFERTTRGGYNCTSCGGKLKQLDLIYMHKCGYAGQVQVRACPIHGKEHMRLVRGASIGEDRWVCGQCGQKISLNTRCPSCNHPKFIHPVPFRQGDVYMRKGLSMINLPFIDEERMYSDPLSAKMIVGEYLGLTKSYGFEAKELLSTAKESIADAGAETLQKDIERWKGAGLDEKQIEVILGSNVFSKTQFKKQEIREKVAAEIDRLLPCSPEELKETAISVFEYMETLKMKNKKHMNEVIAEAKATNSPILTSVNFFPKLLRRIGVSDSYILGDLSMVNAAYGFTREEEDGPDSTLMPFNWDRLDGKRIPIYINKTETEAILLELDRIKILKWLLINKKISQMPEKTDDPSLKIWFLQNVNTEAITSFADIPDKEVITKAVYGLLHSMSHSLLIRASSQCGLDKDSLGELIFPEIPAMLIYSNSSTSFQLGGLFTLFESKIRPWLDLALQDAESCIYDPLCIDDMGACHSCLFTSEISCGHFNKDLSRKYLIGGKNMIGFWEKSFQEEFEK
jgi:DNA-directed RNA polymerase subunit RPC12/RpoP